MEAEELRKPVEHEPPVKARFELVQLLLRTSLVRERLIFGLASLLAVANGAGFPLLPVLFARTMSRLSLIHI